MADIIFNPNLNPSSYILDRLYQVRTMEEALRSQEDIEMFGTPSTGFDKYDAQLVNSYTTCAINIARMAKIHAAGYYIGLCRGDDTKPIYQCVQYYLESWMNVMRNGINRVKVPYEKLYQLDRFAQLVYPSAAPRFTSDFATADAMDNWIEALVSQIDIPVASGEKAAANTIKAPDRVSLQDELLDHQARWMR